MNYSKNNLGFEKNYNLYKKIKPAFCTIVYHNIKHVNFCLYVEEGSIGVRSFFLNA